MTVAFLALVLADIEMDRGETFIAGVLCVVALLYVLERVLAGIAWFLGVKP